jgi:hypothetical protein|tara:strand:+ start:892 stop:1431 length:540 start_codon:yes stop_codon:yes gene_type:complete
MSRTKLRGSGITNASVSGANLTSTAVVDNLGFTPASPTDITTAIDALVDSAPGTLNTLNELALALGDNPDIISTLTPRSAITGSVAVATGTTAQRDSTAYAGYFRFNNQTTSFEGYDGAAWGSVGGGGYGSKTISANTTLDINTEYNTGSGLSTNVGITLSVPASSLLTIKYYSAGKTL